MTDDILYRAMEPLGGERTRLHFSGCFRGQEIVWEVQLLTLASYYRTLPRSGRYKGVRQFIDVASVGNGTGSLTVALHLPRIDEPAVLKAIIMVRQWKRLAIGRHEYGELHHYGAKHSA